MNTERINAITETILDNIHDDTLMEILYNVVKYTVEHNNSKNKLDCKGNFHGYCIRGIITAAF